MWFMEEVGELSGALRDPTADPDNLAWSSPTCWRGWRRFANIAGVDLDDAVRKKYGAGCPKCGATPCACWRGETVGA